MQSAVPRVQVDIVSGNVTNVGTFAVQEDGAALTALQLIDDAVYVDDADWTDGSSKHLLVGGVYQSSEQSITDGDVGPLSVDANGRLKISIEADNAGIGGGTQYTEDAAAATNPVGNAVILVRDDTPGTQTSTDGDNVAQRGTNYGAAFVQIVDSSGNFVDSFGGSGGTAAADDADFTAGTTQGTLAQGVYESSPTSVTDGDIGAVGITATRLLKVQPTDFITPAGDSMVDDTNDALQVNIVAGSSSGTEYTEDVATANPIVGSAVMMERDDALGTLTPIEGDWAALRCSAEGALWVQDFNSDAILADTANMDTNLGTLAGAVSGSEMQVDVVAALPAGDNNIGNVDIASSVALDVSAATVTVDLGANNDVTIDGSSIVHAEDTTHNTGDAGVMSLAVRNDTLAALAGTDGDYAPLQVNASGALFIQEGSALDVSGATVTVDLGANNDVTIDNSSIVLAEDAVHSTGAAGIMPLAVRNDTLAALAGTDGDYAPVQVDATGAVYTAPSASAGAEGTSTYYDNDLDETKAEVTDNANVRIYSIHAINTTDAPLYLQMFDLDADSVTVGTTTPTNQYLIPGNADSDGAGFTLSFPVPKKYTTGFTVACTTNSEGSTAPGANACHVNIEYISAA